MTSQTRRWVHRTISILIDTGPVGDGSWRWSILRVLALVAPGSVPLALLMFAAQNQVLTHNYGGIGIASLLALFPAVAVLLARFRPLPAWLLTLLGFLWTSLQSTPGHEPWPWSVVGMMSLWIVQFAVARNSPAWVSLSTWLSTAVLSALIGMSMDVVQERQNFTLVALLSAVATVAGLAIRSARLARQRLAVEEQLTADERAKRTLLEERARIARDTA